MELSEPTCLTAAGAPRGANGDIGLETLFALCEELPRKSDGLSTGAYATPARARMSSAPGAHGVFDRRYDRNLVECRKGRAEP